MATKSFNDLLNESEDTGYALFPEGQYDVVVEEASGEPAKSGRDQVAVTLKVLNGPLAGRQFRHFMTVVSEYPGLVAQWFAEMGHLGMPRDYFRSEPSYETVARNTIGRQVRVVVGRRLNKKTKEETEDIKIVGTLSGAPGVPSVPGVPAAPAVPAPAPVPVPVAHAADKTAPNLPPF